MIDAKEAVRIAMSTMTELYSSEQIPGLAPEEVELADSPREGAPRVWVVTLGHERRAPRSAIEAMTGQQAARAFKVFHVSAETGEVLSMKIRQL